MGGGWQVLSAERHRNGLRSDVTAKAIRTEDRAVAEGRIRCHLSHYFADAFATYTMGPAYACSAILMRFNPALAFFETDESPPYANRAHLVLTMLGRMSSDVGASNAYLNVLQQLEKIWRDELERVAIGRSTDIPETAAIERDRSADARTKRLVDMMWAQFDREFYPTAKHPPAGGGWLVAQTWSAAWTNELKNQRKSVLSLPDVEKTSTLRNALNAAWLCRMDNEPEDIPVIAEAARRLCDDILQARKSTSMKGSRGRRPGAPQLAGGRK